MNNMANKFVTCGEYRVALWLHTSVDPSNAEWNLGCQRVAELKQQLGGDVSKLLSLALSDGGAPNSVQRGRMFTDVMEGTVKTAVVTGQLSNRLVRGIATAISWLSPTFRAFPPEQFSQALAHLGLVEYQALIIAEFLELQKSMEPIQTLATIATLAQGQK